jgi:hypothetical protein
MLALLKSLPALLVLLLGFVGGGAVTGGIGGLGFWAWSTFVEAPHVRDLVKAAADAAEQACVIRMQQAAADATAAGQRRQQQVSEDALAIYQTALDHEEAARRAAEDALALKTKAHDDELAQAHRSFVVTDSDFDWLRDHKPQPAP